MVETNAKWKADGNTSNGSSPLTTIAILGLPNTGKSQVFNNLTGEYALVANYPLTTIEMKRATCDIEGRRYEVIDTPGLHCLYIHSEEELIVRNMIFSQPPDIVIQCIDANQLKQSLTLTADLLELGIPMVICLNAIDETARRGVWIDSPRLSRLLGVPVVESIAVKGLGTRELRAAIRRARAGKWSLRYGEIIDDAISAIESGLPADAPFKRKTAVLLLVNDPFLADSLEGRYGEEKVALLKRDANRVRRHFRGHLGRALNDKRSRWVDDLAENATRRQRITPGEFSRAFGRLSRHPVFGLPILFFFLACTYLLVVHAAGSVEAILNASLVAPTVRFISGRIPSGFWNDFFVGDYGILTLGLFNALCTVLPILSVFFLMFGVLEDVGYLPNLCVLTRSIFEKIGLTGKAIMPLMLGFGCKTMGTLVTRGISSRKEKFIAVYLIAFAVPCSAQLAIGMGILGRVGVGAFLIGYGSLAIIGVGAGLALNRFLKEDRSGDFIQELPAIRVPDPRAILLKTYYRLCWFLKEATPVFIAAAAGLFLLDKAGLLHYSKELLTPVVVDGLNLPIDMVDAFILSFARHEAAAALVLNMVRAGRLNYIQCIVAVVMTATFVPCFANIVAIARELGVKTAVGMAVGINISSLILAVVLNFLLAATIGRWIL